MCDKGVAKQRAVDKNLAMERKKKEQQSRKVARGDVFLKSIGF
jgi:hypothetical protein